MAIAFAEVKTHSRKHGHSAVAAAAYRTRSRLVDERTGEVFDYRHKAHELEHTQLYVPQAARGWLDQRRAAGMSAQEIRSELWNAVERDEHRHDSRVGRDWTVALPWELTPAQRRRVAYEIAQYIADRHAFTHQQKKKGVEVPVQMHGHGVAVEYSLHRPHERADERNYHIHFHITSRRMDAQGFTDKAQELDNPTLSGEHIEAWRQGWQRIVNRALERGGYGPDQFIDMRSYERQGKDLEAERHMGSGPAALERDGIRTEVGNYNRAVRQRNAARQREAQQARLTDRANVIDFAAKRAARDRRKHQALQYTQSLERQGRMRNALERLRRVEEGLRRPREAEAQRLARESSIAKARGILTPSFNDQAQGRDHAMAEIWDRDEYNRTWQERVEQAGIDHAEGKTIGQQWDTHAVQPAAEVEKRRQAEAAKRGKIEEWANERRADIQSRQMDERIAMERRQSRAAAIKEEEIRKAYGASNATNERRIHEIETRQAKGGLFYRLRGRAHKDREALDGLRLTLENGRWREEETRNTYKKEQAREMENLLQGHARENAISERWIEQAFATGRIPEDTRGREPELGRETPQHDMGRSSGGGGDGGRQRSF